MSVVRRSHAGGERGPYSTTVRTLLLYAVVRAWRASGYTLCDIHLLVFNMGRTDFRGKFVEPFTAMIQSIA